MPQSVTVYQFEYFDRASGTVQVAPDYATEASIQSMGANALLETAKEVPAQEITFSGLWRPEHP